MPYAEVSIYPNPTTDRITVKTEAPSAQITNMGIQTLDGMQLDLSSFIEGNSIDLRTLANGVYYLSFTVDGIKKSMPFIKQ